MMMDDVDTIAVELLDDFADALAGRKNDRGGIFRGGTGSAMYYLWHADEIGASPDGRRKGEAFGANYSPSLFAKTKGPFSLIKSFVKPNLKRVINGGPLTLEFHSSMFTDEACIQKVAQLVKTYIDLGGHQLQLNAVNADVLRDAQQHRRITSSLSSEYGAGAHTLLSWIRNTRIMCCSERNTRYDRDNL